MGEPASGERASVLVVDDEPLLARAIGRTLSSEFVVCATTSGRDALSRLVGGESYAAIVCDLLMADMTGMELYEVLTRVAPRQAARMLFLTGGAFTTSARSFVEGAGRVVLRKPFDRELLRAAVRRMVGASQAQPFG